jgi:hypothetical protein
MEVAEEEGAAIVYKAEVNFRVVAEADTDL